MNLRVSREPISRIDIPRTRNTAISVQRLKSLIPERIVIKTPPNSTATAPIRWMPIFSLRKRKVKSVCTSGRAYMIIDAYASGAKASATKMPIVATPSPKLCGVTLGSKKAQLQTRLPFIYRVTTKPITQPTPNAIMTTPVGKNLIDRYRNWSAKVKLALLAPTGNLTRCYAQS